MSVARIDGYPLPIVTEGHPRAAEALQAITDTLCVIVKREAFWGVLVSKLKARIGGCPTAGINQDCILKVNPDYLLGLTLKERAGLLLHEVGHAALDTWGRRDSRDHKIWNKATDYKINQLIEESAQWASLPKGGLRDHGFDDLSAEQVYDILAEEQKPGDDPGYPVDDPGPDGPGGGGGGDDSQDDGKDGGGGGDPGPNDGKWGAGTEYGDCDLRDIPGKSQAQVSADRTDWQTALIQAAEIARQRGNLPGSLADLVGAITAPAIPWRSVLRRFVEASIERGDDQSYLRPGRRSWVGNRLTPGDLPEPDPIVIAIDTSGSCLGDLPRFLGEVGAILKLYPNAKVRYIVVDAAIQYDGESANDIEEVRKHCTGGGGTDFSEVFERLDKGTRPAGLVFLTDLCAGGIPDRAPAYPVLWAVPHGYEQYAQGQKWGKILTIPDDGAR